MPAVCAPGSDTEHPAQVKLKAAGLAALSSGKLAATFTPAGAIATVADQVQLECAMDSNQIVGIIASGEVDIDFTSLTLVCEALDGPNFGAIYFRMENRVVTGPPPAFHQIVVGEAVSDEPRARTPLPALQPATV